MRILIDYRPALRERTGVGEYAHHLARALLVVAPGLELTVFSSSWKDRLAPGVIPGARTVDARLPVRLLNLAWHRLSWPPVDWLAGDVDVTQAMHPIAIPARRAARFITINDLHFLDRPEHTAAEIRRDYGALVGHQVRAAAGIVVISEYMKAAVERRLGANPDRVVVCPPGAPDWAPREPHPEDHRGPILFVGTLEPRKNLAALLRAYAELLARKPDAPPLILAGRPGPGSDAFLADASRPEFQGRVRLLGYVSDEDRQRLYREASVLVLPSLDEGFGMPVLEAMTVGVPVVAADRGALPEVLAGAGLLVNPDSPGDLAQALERVLGDEGLRSRMVEAGVRRSRAYSWTGAAARLHAAYTAALAQRTGPRHG